MGELKRGGEGTLLEVDFQVDDIEEFHAQMEAEGVTPLDLAGQPISVYRSEVWESIFLSAKGQNERHKARNRAGDEQIASAYQEG